MKRFVVLLGVLALGGLSASPASAGGLKKYYSKATFLTDTVATSATGPLPDAGRVLDAEVDPLGTYGLGSLTFRLAVRSDYIYVGAGDSVAAPDWYPQTPGHDMAFGWENMQVSMAGPVYSFGFDIVEPDATMPSFGGTPEESTYEFLLFNGASFVGRVQFEGTSIPNDVEAFIGVWSDRPFDRVVVNDITGGDDDEFLGEFYTGTTPLGCTVDLGLSYSGGTLSIDLGIGTSVPRTWNLWVVFGENTSFQMFSLPLPAVTPTLNVPLSFPVPPLGEVGFLTTLATNSEGIACSDFKTVSTSP
jgi:hypothetical protein